MQVSLYLVPPENVFFSSVSSLGIITDSRVCFIFIVIVFQEPRHCKLWKEMEKTGVLNMELVEHVFSEFCQQGVVKEDILEMMMKFGLIVQFALSPTEKKNILYHAN